MQRTSVLALIVLVSGCWRRAPSVVHGGSTATRTPSPAPTEAEPSYRQVTIGLDAAAVGLLAASTVAYAQRGGDDPLAVGLLLAGGAAALGAPIVHAAHGHGARAGASYLLRSIFVSAGMVAGMQIGCARDAGWFCGLGPELGWGMVGGLAVAGTLDAFLLHGTSSTWSPTLVPSEGGARVGVVRAF